MFTRFVPALFVLLWSTGFIGSKAGAPFAEPATFLTVRFAVVLAILVPLCLLTGAKWPRRMTLFHALAVGALIHGLYLGGVFWAISNGMPAGVSAVIVSLQPILTAIVAWPLLGERTTLLHWLGLAIGLVGVLAILLPKAGLGASGITPATVSACVIALAGITLSTIYQKKTMAGVDLRTSAALQYLGALCLTAAWAFAFETREVIWDPQFIAALAWLVVVLSIGAIGLLMMMIRESAVSRVATLFYLVPAVTALIAWALFGETLELVQLGGMALVSLAVMLASRANLK